MRRWLTDLGLALVVLMLQSAPFLFTRSAGTAWEGWSAQGYWPVLLTSLPVLTRRWQPGISLAVSAVGIAAYAVIESGPAQPIWYGPLVIFYTVAYQAGRIERLLCVIGTVLGAVSVIGSVNTAVRELATWSAAYALGTLARTRKEAAAASRAQAEQLAAERERTRIARDLHDILGHAFSLMIVQAEAGGAVARSDPGKAEAAFDAISAHGREAMGQLRSAVGALRDRSPQPSLADIPQLVRRTQRSGLSVAFAETGSARDLPPDVQLAAYRLVQEALTNVVKHSGASRADVSLAWGPRELSVTVEDDGHGPGADGGGHGLIGIRERVTAAGGTVETGVAGQGRGFRVAAVFS
ncbi:MAG: sensor histidine kinase [Hamadaea sp.]|nr:sensor histidine kinase [Hamadaea sp.]